MLPSLRCLLIVIASLPFASAQAERRFLHRELVHLRSGNQREWSDFPPSASGDRLQIRFAATPNPHPVTLGLRRVDVKEGWSVSLNGQKIGSLFSDENDMEEVWELPPGSLRERDNTLLIEATSARIDDVRIGAVWIDPRPREAALGDGRLQLQATDRVGEPLPCRWTILNQQGALAAIGSDSNDERAVRSGVVYAATGQTTIGLAAGRYTVLCGRGFEYSLDRQEVVVEPGTETTVTATLQRVVDTSGLVACDPHVHTFEVSRHGDATLDERMVTLAGEGIELAVATDHNTFVDYRPHLRRLGLADQLTSIIGNEVTTPKGHFNIFPARRDAALPNHRTEDWDILKKEIDATPDVRVAILNHARDAHAGFTPFAPENVIGAVGARLDGRQLRANAMEVINSAALQTDPMVLFHDWLTRLNRGHSLTAVGTSDSHEVSRKIVGQGRSYIYVDDSDPGAIDVDAAVQSMIDGRVLVSLGLLAELTVAGQVHSGESLSITDDSFTVRGRVQGPGWVRAERLVLYANGIPIRSQTIPSSQQAAAGIKADIEWQIERPSQDVHLVLMARGPGVRGLHWPIAKPYQPSRPVWEPYVFGCSGAVRIDTDGDGVWTASRAYANSAIEAADGNFAELLQRLARFDRSVAVFAAHRWVEAGGSIRSETARQQLRSAPSAVQDGFAAYARSQRESLDAGGLR